MTTAKTSLETHMLFDLLTEWDKGNKIIRKKILLNFVEDHRNKTGTELEESLAFGASLFLARLTAWLRISYMVGPCVKEILQAANIFLSASNNQQYITEFIEVGSVMTTLEVLELQQSREEDKLEALKVLYSIASAGRKYKELICESYGVKSIAQCLATSKSEATQEQARAVLEELSKGNPKFQNQVYKGFIAVLPCNSPKAQQIAAKSLQMIQETVGHSNPSIEDPLLNLLRSMHVEVQYEAINLIKVLMNYESRDNLLKGLVAFLTPSRDEVLKSAAMVEDYLSAGSGKLPLPVFLQQAAAAKGIGILAKDSIQIAEKLINLDSVRGLLFAMGNTDHPETQRQAAMTLEYFVRSFAKVELHLKEAMGDQFFDQFMKGPDVIYLSMTSVQAEICRTNYIKITGEIS